ncbi:MAG: Uma2 family endonuclease [Hyphomicrobiaceae bacterium]
MTAQPKPRLTVPEFLDWAASQRGRYELVGGKIVAMAPERARHNIVKGAVFRALGDAVKQASLPCTVFTDGMTVEIDNEHSREPDAAVRCGATRDPDAMTLVAPLIVVEVSSPSSERDDTGHKLVEYFSVPSIRHYLIVKPDKEAVIHHARNETGEIATRIVHEGEIDLTPPGILVPVERFFPAF